MADNPQISFENDIREMTPKKLLDFVNNWLWEGPLEYTPTIEQTERLIKIIQTRADKAHCEEAVLSCQEYLRPLKPSGKNPYLENSLMLTANSKCPDSSPPARHLKTGAKNFVRRTLGAPVLS